MDGETATRSRGIAKVLAALLALVCTWVCGWFAFYVCGTSLYNFHAHQFLIDVRVMPVALVVLSVFLWASIASMFIALSRRVAPALLLTLLLSMLFSATNYFTLRQASQVIVPADVYFFSQLQTFCVFVPPLAWVGVVLGLVSLALLLWLMVRPGRRMGGLNAAVYAGHAVTGLAIMGGMIYPATTFGRFVVDAFPVHREAFDPHAAMVRNGLLLTFVSMISESTLIRPEGLGLKDSRALLGQPPSAGSSLAQPLAGENAAARKFIVLLLESWMDPAWLDFHFNQDPAPNFHALLKAGSEFRLLSPVVGGGTANVEFELLTGLSLQALPRGAFPYFHFIRRPMASLVTSMTSAGYHAVAVHNFIRTFWQRNVVYPFLGFEQFLTGEDSGYSEHYLIFPKDAYLYNMMYDELIKPGPRFVFGISVVTHNPYEVTLPTEERTIRILTGSKQPPLPEPLKDAWETYFNKMHSADQDLGDFIARLRGMRDVTLVAFGDHQPNLISYTPNYINLDLATLGKAQEAPELVRAQLNLTPAVAWTPAGGALRQPPPRAMTMSCFTPYLLRLADVTLNPLYAYLDRLCRDKELFGNPADGAVEDARYRNLVYDAIFNSPELLSGELPAPDASPRPDRNP